MSAAAIHPVSVTAASHRLGALVQERSTMAQWWVELAAALDELSDRMLNESHAVWHSMRLQLTDDAPHLSSHLRRIDAEQESLHGHVRQVRVLAGEAGGDPDQATRIRDEVRGLLQRLRRHERRTTRVLVDAYVVDLGGE